MSTLKTNNIEHLDASTPSIQTTIGGGVVFAGLSTFQGNAQFDGNVNIAGTVTYDDVTNIDSVGIITAQSGIHVTGGSVGIGTNDPSKQVVIYNGTTPYLFFQNSTSGTGTNDGFSIGLGGTECFMANREGGKISFEIGSGSEKFAVLHSGDVSIPNDNAKLLIGDSDDFEFYFDGTNNVIATDGPNIRIGTAGENFARFVNNGQAELYYNNSKKIETTTTGVTVTGNITLGSGNGINFSANQASNAGLGVTTSSLFDDYEEGTWTPTLSFNGGTTGMTVAVANGNYTKIGRQVIANARFEISAKGSSSGEMRLTMPYAADNMMSGSYIDGNAVFGYTSGLDSAQIGSDPLSGYISAATDYVVFNARRSTGDAVTLNETDIDDDFSFMVTVFYYHA